MNARFAFALLPFVVLASCADDDEPVVSGGAQFQLQNAAAADNPGMLGTCPDGTSGQLRVAGTGADGQPVLVANGAEDARVGCSYSATSFNVAVSRNSAQFTASGSIKPKADCAAAELAAYGDASRVPGNIVACSLDATVFVSSPGGNAYKTRDKRCSIFFTQNTEKKLRGDIHCPLLEHSTIANACRIKPDTSSFFAFANCAN